MNKDKMSIIIVFIIIGLVFFYGLNKEKKLSENENYTTGKITEYYYIGSKTYIKYTFFLKSKK